METTPSKRYTLNKEDGQEIAKVIGWTLAAALVTVLIDVVGLIDMPAQYALIVPIVNTILVALKKFIQEKQA